MRRKGALKFRHFYRKRRLAGIGGNFSDTALWEKSEEISFFKKPRRDSAVNKNNEVFLSLGEGRTPRRANNCYNDACGNLTLASVRRRRCFLIIDRF